MSVHRPSESEKISIQSQTSKFDDVYLCTHSLKIRTMVELKRHINVKSNKAFKDKRIYHTLTNSGDLKCAQQSIQIAILDPHLSPLPLSAGRLRPSGQ